MKESAARFTFTDAVPEAPSTVGAFNEKWSGVYTHMQTAVYLSLPRSRYSSLISNYNLL